ncbi:MAG TPA: YqeG family HAD IIIA-type phosphatase [Firmicutes bacterium]|nr:YqeG family HAD IIIA-type phosphatase [Bacillota bacterium]
MGIFKPDYRFNSILDISPDFLRKNGINALLLDVDNTLAHHFSQIPIDGLETWLERIDKAGIKTMILSNARGSRVEPFAKKIGVDYTPKAMKPLPFKAWKSCSNMQVKSKNTAIIGDQLFTDMLCGTLSGITTILVTPMHEETGRLFKIKRGLERKILK